MGTANKPANTKFRGNHPGLGNAHTYGMANEAVPSTPDWAVQKMWVIDLDPKLSGAPVTAHAFFFAWAYDVLVENVFSIQNPTVTPAGAAIEGVTSHQAVMVFHPSKGAPYIADREKTQMAHRIHISWHYNILSPAGFGPNQITACLDCTFDHLYSHGGTTLRLETDAIKPLCGYDHCGACNGVVPGPKGVGFDSYGLVDGLSATHLRGEDGNRVVSLSPHCLPNGVVHLDDVRGKSMVDVIRMTDHTGYFSSESTLSNVAGVGGDVAEVPVPKMLGFQLTPSRDAFYNDAAHYTLKLSGTFCWPGSLANGRVPKGGTLLSPPHCDDGMGLLP